MGPVSGILMRFGLFFILMFRISIVTRSDRNIDRLMARIIGSAALHTTNFAVGLEHIVKPSPGSLFDLQEGRPFIMRFRRLIWVGTALELF
jgi:hypothetical protein